MDQPVRPHIIKLHITTAQPTAQQEGGGIVLLNHRNIKATLVELGDAHTMDYALWKTIL